MFPDQRRQTFEHIRLTDLADVAKHLLEVAGSCRIWLFSGEMGAGKTTFIKQLGAVLGVTDRMASPTFSIVNEYMTGDRSVIYHFDFFRLKHEAEALDIGIEEYFSSGNYCFIEWPEKIRHLIPLHHARVTIGIENESLRTIAFSLHDGKEENRI